MKTNRKAKGWKVEELSRRLIDAGYPATVGSVRVWESPRGRDPKPDTIQGMERIFGSVAPSDAAGRSDDALLAAVERLTEAVEALPLRIATALRQVSELPPDVLARLVADEGEPAPSQPHTESDTPTPIHHREPGS